MYKKAERQLVPERGFFPCSRCKKMVPTSEFIGTKHRNHCPFCLWSRHLDLKESGDRKSKCGAEMKPIRLTFKKEGKDKWGKEKPGEIMLVHQCLGCGKISINRIAGDDKEENIIKILENSKKLGAEFLEQLKKEEIRALTEKDKREILNQLYGKKF